MRLKKLIADLLFVFTQTKTMHQQHKMPLRKLIKHIHVYLTHKNESIMICLVVSKVSRFNFNNKILIRMRFLNKCSKDRDLMNCLDRHSLVKEWDKGKVVRVGMILLLTFLKTWCKVKWEAINEMVTMELQLLHSNLKALKCNSKGVVSKQKDLRDETSTSLDLEIISIKI